MFKSWVAGAADDVEELLGRRDSRGEDRGDSRGEDRGAGIHRSSGDADLDAAMSELDDFLDMGRTETEAKERERARREREAASRSSSSYSRPAGPPERLVRAYRSLGLAYGTPFPEVKAAYKRLLMQNHPDRNSATPEQLKRSTEISAQLNAAYQTIETWNSTGKLDDS